MAFFGRGYGYGGFNEGWGGYGGGYGGIDRSEFAEMSKSTLARLDEAKSLFTTFVETAVFAPGATKAFKAGAVEFHLTGAAYSALSKWVKATYPGCCIHRVELTADQKAAHPKYKTKASKVIFADFTCSLQAHQARLAAVAAVGGGAAAADPSPPGQEGEEGELTASPAKGAIAGLGRTGMSTPHACIALAACRMLALHAAAARVHHDFRARSNAPHRAQCSMGQAQSGAGGAPGEEKDKKAPPKKFEPRPPPTRVGKKQRRKAGDSASRLPSITPTSKCKLRLLKLERVRDYLLLEEEYVTNQEARKPLEARNEAERSKVDEMRGNPMSVGSLEEMIDDNHAIVSSTNGPEYYVSIMSFVDKSQLEPGCSVLMHNKSLSVVGILSDEVDPLVSVMKVEKAPTESYADIGGLEDQIQEIKESVELPLTHPELYEDIGIKPPKGVILYGEPGTGKTLLAKAVANSTSATFLRVVGSELIQKYLGDGPKLVRELFRVADELAPSIVFIDEIDAVGTKRYDSTSGGEREIQRTMLELLNQMDGFDARSDVKVIMATNRIETLDPALLRPGRIDRKIEFPLPDAKTKRRIFTIHTSRMSLADDVVLEEFVMSKNELSGADIKAMCTEAGLLALRERRMRITHADFKKALDKLMYRKKDGAMEGLYL